MASSSITSWQTEGKKVEVVTDFLFLGSKITADSDCSHEIRRWSLLGRETMTNIDNMLKSRDITLLTKGHILKATVFPEVMYNGKSWTITRQNVKELMPLNCGAGEDLRVLWTTRRSKKSILKEINPEYSLEGLMLKLKLQYFGYLMQRDNSLEKTRMLWKTEGKKRTGWQKMRWFDSITDLMDMKLSELQDIMEDRGACMLQSMGSQRVDLSH